MFIQKIQPKDVREFLSKRYNCIDNVSTFLERETTSEPYLFVTLTVGETKIGGRLYDFECHGFPGNWQAFLYKKFGSLYKSEYRKYLESQIDKKLDLMECGKEQLDMEDS